MGKPIDARPSQPQPMTVESLLAPDGIESLVRAERVPSVMKLAGPKSLAIIPPVGTQFGDKITHGAGVGHGDMGFVVFESPDGVQRGVAETIEITTSQINAIETRVARALKDLKR